MAAHSSALLLSKATTDTDVSLVTSGSNYNVSFVIYLLFAHRIHRIDRDALQTVLRQYMMSLESRGTRCDCAFPSIKFLFVWFTTWTHTKEASQLLGTVVDEQRRLPMVPRYTVHTLHTCLMCTNARLRQEHHKTGGSN